MIVCTYCGKVKEPGPRVDPEFMLNNTRDFWLHICRQHPEKRSPCLDVTEPPFNRGERVRQVFTTREGLIRFSQNDPDQPGRSLYIVGWLDGGSAVATSDLWLLRSYDPDPLFVRDNDSIYAPDANNTLWSMPIRDECAVPPGKHYADQWGIMNEFFSHESDKTPAFIANAAASPSVLICSFCDQVIEGDNYFSVKKKVKGQTTRGVACSPQCAIHVVESLGGLS